MFEPDPTGHVSGQVGFDVPVMPVTKYVYVVARQAWQLFVSTFHGEFDPGSGRTLAACLTHASGATNQGLPWG
jgi:hypothetical protein